MSEADDKRESLWNSFLSSATKATYKHEEATIIICGNKGNPFAEIIHSMKSSSGRMGRPRHQLPYFLNYRYVDADTEVDDALHLHTWTVQDDKYFEQISTVVPKEHIESGRLGYIICIDTSKPSTIKEQVRKWAGFVNSAQKRVFEKVGDAKAQEMKDAISRSIQFYEVSGADENLLDDDEKAALELDRSRPKVNAGALITVVICNTNKFAKNYPQSQAAANKNFEKAILFLRKECVEFGATIFTFANRRQGVNIKQYIDSVLMGNKISQEPQIANVTLQELKEEQIFVPVGFDSEALLANTTLIKKYKFEDVFHPKKQKKSRKRHEYKQLSQPDDQHFLALLKFKLEEEKNKMEKMDKRAALVLPNVPTKKKYMNDPLQPVTSLRKHDPMLRRSSMNMKQRRVGGGRKDINRFDTLKALGMTKALGIKLR